MRMLKSITSTHGRPLALYHDRHSIFEETESKIPSLEEQLAGKRPQTQLARVLAELGINSISARSPQAKGRIERLWGTFQDRLVSELRLAGICTAGEANKLLRQFLPDYNQRFMVQAKEPGSAYRQLPADFKANEVFCYKYKRVVGTDNVVRFDLARLQILPSSQRHSYARCRVEVQVRLDNTLAIYYQGQPLKTKAAPLEATVLRKHYSSPVAVIPSNHAADAPAYHPWKQWVYR
jgi:hypothetical protein